MCGWEYSLTRHGQIVQMVAVRADACWFTQSNVFGKANLPLSVSLAGEVANALEYVEVRYRQKPKVPVMLWMNLGFRCSHGRRSDDPILI